MSAGEKALGKSAGTIRANAEIDRAREQIVVAVFDECENGGLHRRAIWLSFDQARELAPRLESCVARAENEVA